MPLQQQLEEAEKEEIISLLSEAIQKKKATKVDNLSAMFHAGV